MIIKANQAKKKERKPMVIRSYPINPDWSGTLIDIDGEHGNIKCLREDRLYFIISGKGTFVLDGQAHEVSDHDLVFVPRHTVYNIIGKMKYFLVCSPAFDPADDVYLDE